MLVLRDDVKRTYLKRKPKEQLVTRERLIFYSQETSICYQATQL